MVHRLWYPTHATVLGLPSVEIHQCRKWLSKDCERNPKYDISEDAAAMAEFHLLKRSSNGDEGKLEKHAKESDA